jgi:predicted nucleotide-binding protein
MGTQLGAAHAIIANIALTMPRDKRRGFLVLQRDKIAELTKFAVEKEASAKLDSL